MSRIKLVTTVLILLVSPVLAYGATIDWKKYDKGVSLAKQGNKKIFLHFKAEWCPSCRVMAKTTFNDTDIIKYLNENFINIKVDGDKQYNLLKKYKVRGYPDNLFLNEDGELVYRRIGGLEPETFHFFLEYVQTESYKTKTPMEYFQSR